MKVAPIQLTASPVQTEVEDLHSLKASGGSSCSETTAGGSRTGRRSVSAALRQEGLPETHVGSL